MPQVTMLFLCFGALSSVDRVAGDGFLGMSPDLDAQFQSAMLVVMGCSSGDGGQSNLSTIEQAIEPVWRVLPKNGHGRVEWRMLRYLAHRYFMQKSSLLLRGFEPTAKVNSSQLNTATGILEKRVPALVETMIQGKHNANGFSLDDAAVLVATLERLIYDSETTILEQVYVHAGKSIHEDLSYTELAEMFEAYMVHWMIGEDQEGIRLLLGNASLREEVVPNWHEIRKFAAGMIKQVEFSRRQRPQSGGSGRVVMSGAFSFDDAHEAVGGITGNFASFWHSECQHVKSALIALDKTGAGRVSLADFYSANMDGEWHFGESESYLRDLGALDESNFLAGPQVIIPNYLQGASNCVVATSHYLVCCVNECEARLNAIEAIVNASVADPEQILTIVSRLRSEDESSSNIGSILKDQLKNIAGIHGGLVPLHGRLFSQWLHYVFPQECPFPHKAGTVSTVHLSEFQTEEFIASESEMRVHTSARQNISSAQMHDVEGAQWMSQWSEDEELHADYGLHLSAPWDIKRNRMIMAGTCAAVALLLYWSGVISSVTKGEGATRLPAAYQHAHLV